MPIIRNVAEALDAGRSVGTRQALASATFDG
jgi:hypothetical protein